MPSPWLQHHRHEGPSGPLLELRLDRPERHNALVPELLQALLGALHDMADSLPRGLLLTAEGPSFSTGGDLGAFAEQQARIADYSFELVGALNEVILAVQDLPVPVACAVQGPVTGGSLGLLLAADHVVMHERVTVRPWYAAVGFAPDGGWTALLPERIGRSRTLRWLQEDRNRTARECVKAGLADELVADAPIAAALRWLRHVTHGKPGALMQARRLCQAPRVQRAAALEAERLAFVEQIQTPEAQAGIQQYLEETHS